MSHENASYDDTINTLSADAEQLEQVYQAARQAGETDAFKQAIDAGHTSAPDNLLYAAWFYRLRAGAAQAKGYVIAWAWAIPLAVINGLLFWWLSDERFIVTIERFRTISINLAPVIVWLAAPISAAFVLTYFTAVGRKEWRLGVLIAIPLLAAGGYVLLIYPQLGTVPFQEQYLMLMALHLPLLALAGMGVFLLAKHRDPENRFAFLIKTLEILIVGGLFAIAGIPVSYTHLTLPTNVQQCRSRGSAWH